MAKSVTITIQNNTRGRIEGDYDDKALDEHLAFRKSKFWFRSPRAQMGMWDGKTHMFHRNSGTFPLGLLSLIKKWLRGQGLKWKVEDRRAPSSRKVRKVTKLGAITLRDDQQTAVAKALKRGRGIIHGATGSGKTELAVAIVESLGRPCTLFVTGRKKLAKQTRERFALRLGVPVTDIGFIQGGEWQESTVGVYVAVVDTLVQGKMTKKRRQLYDRCELLFIDEAHHSGSTTWYNTIQYCKARYRFGLTGTPVGRSDGGDLYLRAVTGGVVARISSASLIEKGILAKPTIVFVDVLRPIVATVDESWNYIYKQAVTENKRRNRIIIDYANAAAELDAHTLILVKEKAHGQLLEEALVDCKFLHGSTPSEELDEAVRDFESGELSTLVATSIFDEGVDIPNINVLINAAGGKSIITTLQRIGRGLRKKKDNRLLVLDFFDQTNSYLRNHAQQRIDVCRGEKFNVKVRAKPFDLSTFFSTLDNE